MLKEMWFMEMILRIKYTLSKGKNEEKTIIQANHF
jgi:hypothetical protein